MILIDGIIFPFVERISSKKCVIGIVFDVKNVSIGENGIVENVTNVCFSLIFWAI